MANAIHQTICLAWAALVLCLASSARAQQPAAAAASQEITSATLQAGYLQLALEDWGRIPAGIQRSGEPARSEPRPAPYYNPYTRQNETAAVETRRYALRYAPTDYVRRAVRPLLTLGLGRAEADEAHAELVVTDRSSALGRIGRLIQALDTPRPAVVFQVPRANAAQAESILRRELSAEGRLTSLGSGDFVASDSIERLLQADRALGQSRLRYEGTAPEGDDAWRGTARSFENFPRRAPLRIQAPYGGEVVDVEQRSFPLLYASPKAALEAARQVISRGLGQARYDPDAHMLMVTDRPGVLLRLDAYLRVLDSPDPARLYKVEPRHVAQAREALRERLGDRIEVRAFEQDGILVVRGDEQALGQAEAMVRQGLLRPTPGGGMRGRAVSPQERLQPAATAPAPADLQ